MSSSFSGLKEALSSFPRLAGYYADQSVEAPYDGKNEVFGGNNRVSVPI